MATTAGAMRDPRAPHHDVKFYRSEHQLAETVAAFLAEGLEAGEQVVVVATTPHWKLYRQRMVEMDAPLDEALDEGRLVVLDAHATLARIAPRGAPLEEGFAAAVVDVLEPLLDKADAVRAYGEMVDVLWQRGDLPGALALEGLWHTFLERRPFTLLCAYEMSLLSSDWNIHAIEAVCGIHGRAVPGEDRNALDAAVQQALDDVFGPQVAEAIRPLIEATLQPNDRLGGAERTVFWVRRHLPSRIEPLLAASRRRLGGWA